MGLQPLEFSDCLTDSPYFREKLHAHEKELDKTSKAIKGLIQECKDLIQAAKSLSKAQRSFSHNLMEFKFECIGSDQTEDEQVIESSLKEFGKLIAVIEDERDRMLDKAFETVIHPLEGFRKDQIGNAKEEKKKFEKQTTKYCQFMERYLGLKNKTPNLEDEDTKIQFERQNFYRSSMEYVVVLQEVQEKKKFEFVETLLLFISRWLNFYHQGYEASRDFKPYINDLQSKLQTCRENFDVTRNEAKHLKDKMLEVRGTQQKTVENKANCTREGYLYMMDKSKYKKAITGTTWTKHYCKYTKENKILQMIPYSQVTGKGITTDTAVLQSCTRRATDSIERRFCFDITVTERQGAITLQASSDEDMQAWLQAMDGKEPIYTQPVNQKESDSLLDDIGFQFIKSCIDAIEKRGLEEQGLYRVVGVSSKVAKLTNMGLDKRKYNKIDFDDPDEWETKTVTSALKNYFRTLPEPLMSFQLHPEFVTAAKQGSKTLRMTDIHTLVHKLPEPNFEMLKILVKHLKGIAEQSNRNLMTVPNLGVCFGPTLLRPPEETMAAIMDIKWCNIVIEVLIYNYDKIFTTAPEGVEVTDMRVMSSSTTVIASSPKPGRHNNTNSGIIGHHQRSNSDHIPHLHTNNTLSALSNSDVFKFKFIDEKEPSHTDQQGKQANYANVQLVEEGPETYAQCRARLRPNTGIHSQYSPVWSSYSSSLDHNSSHSSSTESVNSRSSHNAQQHSSPILNHHHPHQATPTPVAGGGPGGGGIDPVALKKPGHHNVQQDSCLGSMTVIDLEKSPLPVRAVSRFSQPPAAMTTSGHTGPPPHYRHKKRKSADSISCSISSTSSVSSLSSGQHNGQGRRVRTLYACEAENDTELSFEPNEIIANVKLSREPGWLEGNLNGRSGLIPANYVQYID